MSCEQKTGPATAGDCGPCSPARRNRYFPDKWMTSADYRMEQMHLIERRRLINRAMLGAGIIQGFPVWPLDSGGIGVGTGVAIDCCGRELVACRAVELASHEDVLWLRRGNCDVEVVDPPEEPKQDPKTGNQQQGQQQQGQQQQQRRPRQTAPQQCPPDEEPPRHYLLCAHYAEQPIGGVRIDDGCGTVRCEANYICETVAYSLMDIDHCPPGLCGCLPVLWGDRDCNPSDGGWESVGDSNERPTVASVHDRGTHEQLVHWSLERLKHVDLCEPCKLEPVGEIHVDLEACVPLACVTIGFRCGEPYIDGIVEDWLPRRLARPNTVLFDLIRGCDLVRIQEVGWNTWLEPDGRRVRFSDFADRFGEPANWAEVEQGRQIKGKGRVEIPLDPSDTTFWVCFSGPVQLSSLATDVITFTLCERDNSECKDWMKRVPVEVIAVSPKTDGDPPGTTRAFRPMVAGDFWEGEIIGNKSAFDQPVLVEIEVRTGFILDPLGQEVAGGGRFVPTSGCVPGGRFLSSFTVVPDEYWNDEMAQQGAEPAAEEA